MNVKFLKNVPYFLVGSLLVFALLLTACEGSGVGGGGQETPGSSDGFLPEATEESFPGTDEGSSPGMTGEPFPGTDEGSPPGMTEEPLPGMTEEPSPGVTEVPPPGITEEPPTPGLTEEPPTPGESPQKGTIDSVDLDFSRITLMLDTGETMEVNVDEVLTEVTINGASGTLQDLQAGDTVEVEIDPATNVATSVTVESSGGGL